MNRLLVLVASCSVLGGCAVNCGADWREVGLNEGRLGADPQVERYAASCGNVDRARYEEGWREGFAMRPRLQFL
jgi:hypothetical protein